jgi:phosphoglycerate dehydrogenase-like enzyme
MKLAILDDYQNAALSSADWSVLPGDIEITVFDDHEPDEDALAARLRPFDILCVMRERTGFPSSLIRRLPNLQLLVTSGHRNAAIDVQAAAEAGVTVCGTAGEIAGTTEMIWALIMAVMRDLPINDRVARSGAWQSGLRVGRELRGATLGLLGLGRLGARIAKIAQVFDMRLIAWSQNLTDERAAECGAERVGFEELLSTADIVSVHLVLSRRTRGLIGAHELGLMKPTAHLVNTSRGPIVDEAALVEALRSGTIAGAALDVFDQEPLPADSPLLQLDNAIISPHMAYVTEGTYRTFYGEMVEDVAAWLKGEPVRVIEPVR